MRKKGLYFVEVPVYDREIAVFIGLSHDEAIKEAKKQKCRQSFIDAINWETAKELIEKVNDKTEQTEAAALRVNADRFFLVLKPPKNNWFFWDVLNHETFHLTQFISLPLKMWDDIEPPAYLHSWLFKRLRKFLFAS
jgi:hypothetical protein